MIAILVTLPGRILRRPPPSGGGGGQAYFHCSVHFALKTFFFFFYMKEEISNHFCFNLHGLRYAICVVIIIYLYVH